jgi:hypothetical protein
MAQPRSAKTQGPMSHPMLRLQRQVGNRCMQRIISGGGALAQRQPLPPAACPTAVNFNFTGALHRIVVACRLARRPM